MQEPAPTRALQDPEAATTTSAPLTELTSSFAPYTPLFCEENVYLLLQALPPSSYLRAYAVFISNSSRTCLLFHQRPSTRTEDYGRYVVWDYHVVAVVVRREEGREKVLVLDRDSLLGMPIELEDYIAATFRPELFVSGAFPDLKSRVRIVPSEDFLANFASDRSHMLKSPPDLASPAPPKSATPSLFPSSESPTTTSLPQSSPLPALPSAYIAPPPAYPPLIGSAALARGETHNLWTRFLDMRISAAELEKDPSLEELGVVLEDVGELVGWNW